MALELEHLHESEEKGVDVEKAFIGWTDAGMGYGGSAENVVEEGLMRRVTKLLEELIQSGVMSYSLYLQRMIARGETEDRPGKVSSSDLFIHASRIAFANSHKRMFSLPRYICSFWEQSLFRRQVVVRSRRGESLYERDRRVKQIA